MLATIVLSAGTTRITLRDIPALFAGAFHPELPDGTPRVLSYLQKQAKTEKLANEWCGNGNNFPISLTEADLSALNAGAWVALPRLDLLDDDEGPRKLRNPITEPEWQEYRAAFDATPERDWELIPVWRNTVVEQWIMNSEARKQWKRVLNEHANNGSLKPRNVASGIPTQHSSGEQLMGAFLTVDEFTEFARQFSVDVRVQRMYRRTPLAALLLAQLRNVPADENITVHESIGRFSGQGSMPARDWVRVVEEDVARQAAGYFSVGEAAQMLADENAGLDVRDLVERIGKAQVNGRSLVRQPDKLPKALDDKIREYSDLVKLEELNDWLASIGVEYRLRPALGKSAGFVPLEKLLAPYFAFNLAQLPDEIAERIRTEYELFPWDGATASQRRDLAQQKDMQADPALEAMRTFYFDQAVRDEELSREIEKVTALAASSVTEYARKNEILAQLQQRRVDLNAERWVAPSTDCAEPVDVAPTETEVGFDTSLHATRDQLIAAFGPITGMDLSWFKNLRDSPALLAARKSPGQGGRGHLMQPYFCPMEVMTWLISSKRKKGARLSQNGGWGLLEKNFPKVFAKHAAGDPR